MYPVRIAPSVIAADFGYLRADLARAEQGGADMLHVDIMDGHFVPNISFGPDIARAMRKLTKLPFDVHLMVSKPRQWVTAFVEAGAANITIHIEAEDEIRRCIDEIHYYDCKVGLSVKPKTPLAAIKDHLRVLDRVLVMTVEPGFGGQKFMPDMMPKVQEAAAWRKEGGFKYDIEVDGGINKWTIWDAVRAGAEVMVAGTSVFSPGRPRRCGAGIARQREGSDALPRRAPADTVAFWGRPGVPVVLLFPAKGGCQESPKIAETKRYLSQE